jgi:hypothetical protein
MSFDLFIYHLEAGDAAPADKAAVLEALRQCPDIVNNSGSCVEFADGSWVEFNAEELETKGGVAFRLFGITPSIIAFIYRVALAGDMIIVNAQGHDPVKNPVMILTRPAQSEQIHIEDDLPVLCTSVEHLAALLDMEFEDRHWQSYYNQIASKGDAQ